jgi:hypothetical protein
MPNKFATALGNLELKRKQNAEKKKAEAAKTLKKATNIKHPKATTKGGGKTRKGRKACKTRKGRK